jgi:hypothetical protein
MRWGLAGEQIIGLVFEFAAGRVHHAQPPEGMRRQGETELDVAAILAVHVNVICAAWHALVAALALLLHPAAVLHADSN